MDDEQVRLPQATQRRSAESAPDPAARAHWSQPIPQTLVLGLEDSETWSSPQPVAVTPGRDDVPTLARGSGGAVGAAWLNSSDESTSLLFSLWDGSNWAVPAVLRQTSHIETPAISPTSAGFLVMWSEYIGDIESNDGGWKIYSVTGSGTVWSEPSLLSVSTSQREAQQRPFSAVGVASGFSPSFPPECCEEEEDEIPEPPEPPDGERDEGDGTDSPVLRPVDPNEKVGPVGWGEQGFVVPEAELRYIVYFENLANAAVPAQEVLVTDLLDPNLDWTTFRIQGIGWGDYVLEVPGDADAFQSRVSVADYRSDLDKEWWVDVTVTLDTATGLTEWKLRTVDPETGDLPKDVFAGFLPPNDETHRGEGYVEFSVRAMPDLNLGTTVRNQASIVFDSETHIETNGVVNAIGAVGSLQAMIEPKASRIAGAKWRRTGSVRWHGDGEVESSVPVGQYTLEFKAIHGWATPVGLPVTVSMNSVTSAVVTYVCETGLVAGDVNCDGNVGLLDYADFRLCLTGPGGEPPSTCVGSDMDRSGSVDIRDFAMFQIAFRGP